MAAGGSERPLRGVIVPPPAPVAKAPVVGRPGYALAIEGDPVLGVGRAAGSAAMACDAPGPVEIVRFAGVTVPPELGVYPVGRPSPGGCSEGFRGWLLAEFAYPVAPALALPRSPDGALNVELATGAAERGAKLAE